MVTPARTKVVELAAQLVLASEPHGSVLVAVDGSSGTGKSTFADELARTLKPSGRAVVRASIDSFHNPRSVRYRLGNDSPEGYYRDSHNLRGLENDLLQPFTKGSGHFRSAVFDEPTDQSIDRPPQQVPELGILVFDGLFLHRRELVKYWNLSILLVAGRRCEAMWQGWLQRDLPEDGPTRRAELARRVVRARRHRYTAGQALYEAEALPHQRADVVINNDDLARPALLRVRVPDERSVMR